MLLTLLPNDATVKCIVHCNAYNLILEEEKKYHKEKERRRSLCWWCWKMRWRTDASEKKNIAMMSNGDEVFKIFFFEMYACSHWWRIEEEEKNENNFQHLAPCLCLHQQILSWHFFHLSIISTTFSSFPISSYRFLSVTFCW